MEGLGLWLIVGGAILMGLCGVGMILLYKWKGNPCQKINTGAKEK